MPVAALKVFHTAAPLSEPSKRTRNDPLIDAGAAGAFGEEQARDMMAWRETLELARAYYSIKVPLVRKRVADMVKSIVATLAGD